MTKHQRIIFRADGNATIGLGHLTRSLALATMVQEDFICVFVTQIPSPNFLSTIDKAGIQAIPLPPTLNYQQDAANLLNIIQPSDIVVLDGYNFDTDYQNKIKKSGNKVVCLDDIYAFKFVADVILNQAGGVTPGQYKAELYTQFLFGPAYALLREPFLQAATQTRNIDRVKNIFLNMGGADPDNQTLHLLQTVLAFRKDLNIKVVIGAAYSNLNQLQTYAQEYSGITIYQNLDAAAMCTLMQTCDAAILPPSSVSYEWCSVSGLLFVHQIADNQKDLAAFLIQNGLAFHLSQLEGILNYPDQAEIITKQIFQQRTYFDGKSKNRLKRFFSDLKISNALQLRTAQPEDMQLLYEWVNDPEVRQHSFNPAPIPLEMHQSWFKSKLNNPDCQIFIFSINDVPAGTIRFDIKEKEASISYLLNKDFRGKGLGSWVLTNGTIKLNQLRPDISRLIGHVQSTNVASIISFRKAGFRQVRDIPTAEPNSLVFAKELN